MAKIEKKSYKSGTYAVSEYYLNGEKIHANLVPQNQCGTGWFLSLPEEEMDAELEELDSLDIPYHVDEIIHSYLEDEDD